MKLGDERKSCIVSKLQIHSASVTHTDTSSHSTLQEMLQATQTLQSNTFISFRFTFPSDLLHSRLSLGNARERCISGRITGSGQKATKESTPSAGMFYCTVAISISLHGQHVSCFATILMSVEFNNQLFYTKIKPPPTRRYSKLRKMSCFLL